MNTPEQQENLDLVRDAAKRGVPQAQLLFGQMLLDGIYLESNPSWALYWFERAAVGGELMAVNMVGRCHDQGWGVARSSAMAEPWFRKAAERGLDWGMYNLATLLTLGQDGVRQDKVQAFQWFLKAAKLGHVKSMNILGGFYEDGWVTKQNRQIARDYYRQAAVGGDFRGQFNFGRFLLQEGNAQEALHWFSQVPATATPAFLTKMKAFLQDCAFAVVHDFAERLEVPADAGSQPAAAV